MLTNAVTDPGATIEAANNVNRALMLMFYCLPATGVILRHPNGTERHVIKIVDSTGVDLPGAFVSVAMVGGSPGEFRHAALGSRWCWQVAASISSSARKSPGRTNSTT